jgi:hypothetical protein
VVAEDVVKGEAPPSKWMENCKAALERDNADVDNPFAICTASYQKAHNKMASGDFEKTADGQTIVKITKEDLVDCPACVKKMTDQKIKYYKFTF